MDHTDDIRTLKFQIEDDIRKNPDPRTVVLGHVIAALKASEGGPESVVPAAKQDTAESVPVQSELKRVSVPGSIKKDSKISRLNELVGQYIDEHGPTHRRVLVEVLTDAGLNEGIKNPITAFATSMNTLKGIYVSDGIGTFRRRESVLSDVPERLQGSLKGDTGGVAPPALSNDDKDMRTVESSAEAGGT